MNKHFRFIVLIKLWTIFHQTYDNTSQIQFILGQLSFPKIQRFWEGLISSLASKMKCFRDFQFFSEALKSWSFSFQKSFHSFSAKTATQGIDRLVLCNTFSTQETLFENNSPWKNFGLIFSLAKSVFRKRKLEF